jgi:UDP-N-acetylglucosamine 2-epimerase (non-hydrolysing)
LTEPLRILSVVGTRPNLMKVAPIVAELAARGDHFSHVLVHTGQHYDYAMSQIFFDELGIPQPDHYLDVGSGSHSQQVARVMERLEPLLLELAPDLVMVPGDVNSTMAAALVAAKLLVPIAHVEAGLRSYDRTMPEEINRVVTDQLSRLLFTHSPEALTNLAREGVPESGVHYVGNTMIDTLVAMRERIAEAGAPARHDLVPGSYLVVTLHRPALVDTPLLADAVAELLDVATRMPVVFPVHPRTRAQIEQLDLDLGGGGLRLIEPIGYLEFLGLVADAAGVLTDSGGIQEETTYLGVPCFTLRDNTERPVTVELGTNTLLGLNPERIGEIPALLEAARERRVEPLPLWDGHAARRIADVLESVQLRRGETATAL